MAINLHVVVYGYQFNLFYPDLKDKDATPTFKTHRTDDPDLVVIEFIASEPYRNIAFKIANGDWDKTPRAGYKSVFSHGILNLWVNFKRYRYKR